MDTAVAVALANAVVAVKLEEGMAVPLREVGVLVAFPGIDADVIVPFSALVVGRLLDKVGELVTLLAEMDDVNEANALVEFRFAV
jgi:hypothetical protein